MRLDALQKPEWIGEAGTIAGPAMPWRPRLGRLPPAEELPRSLRQTRRMLENRNACCCYLRVQIGVAWRHDFGAGALGGPKITRYFYRLSDSDRSLPGRALLMPTHHAVGFWGRQQEPPGLHDVKEQHRASFTTVGESKRRTLAVSRWGRSKPAPDPMRVQARSDDLASTHWMPRQVTLS